jgi:uncharacterized protein
MPILSLTAVGHGPVRIREEIPANDPPLREAGMVLNEPVRVDLEARMVGEGVLVRGEIETEVAADCRRCLAPVPTRIRDTIDLLFEPLSGEEAVELGGEVYPLPDRGDALDLAPGIREQLLLRAPDFVVCAEGCRGLCPQCGADLNSTTCECVPESAPTAWDALKDIKFD